jgi:predicted phage terminase large subunit-like protein
VTLTPDVDEAFFRAFAERVDRTPKPRRWASPLDMACDLNPQTVRTPALEAINAALVRLANKPGQGRLAVFMSPQEGKSTLCSFWNPLWLLEHDHDLRIIAISYNAEKSREWGAEVKNAIENFNGDDDQVDLGIRLRADSRAAGRWKCEDGQGGLYCAGIASGITGRAGDYISVDDPTKNLQEAQSARIREKVTSTYRGAIIPRMGPHTKLVWIQTLWHEAETIQDVLANEGDDWEIIRIPAIADAPDDPLGRPIGEPMVSARGVRDWAKIRRDVGEYVFSALYQQRPSPAEGNLFKRLWWRYWSMAPAVEGQQRVDLGGRIFPLDVCWRFLTGDLAASTKTSADWTVAAAWALTTSGDMVLLDLVRARVGEADHFDLFRPLAQRWRVDTAFIEKSFHTSTLAIDATNAGLHITPVDAEGDKFSRALPYSARVSSGRVWLPANAHWAGDFVAEHAAFPNGSHDDMVDVGSYATRVAVTRWSPIPFQGHRRESRPEPNPLGGPEVDLLNTAF